MSEHRATILVVDDDEALRASLKRALEMHDYEVEVAGNAHEARTAMKRPGFEPDLTIMDLVLPGLEGSEAANLLVAHRPQMKVLYISGYTSQESLRKGAMEAGQNFLRKPFDIPELLDAVEDALGRND